MKGSQIILTAEPRGTFLEGIISGTPKAGTIVQVVAGTAAVNGRMTWQVSQLADGALQLPLAILLEDEQQGFSYSAAYVTGTRCRMYVPLKGEEVNMLLGDVSGTGDNVTIGELFGIASTTGKLKKNSSYTSTPFMAMEALAALTADGWVWCLCV